MLPYITTKGIMINHYQYLSLYIPFMVRNLFIFLVKECLKQGLEFLSKHINQGHQFSYTKIHILSIILGYLERNPEKIIFLIQLSEKKP